MGNLFEGGENKPENPVVCSMLIEHWTLHIKRHTKEHAFTVHILMNRFLHSQHTFTYNVEFLLEFNILSISCTLYNCIKNDVNAILPLPMPCVVFFFFFNLMKHNSVEIIRWFHFISFWRSFVEPSCAVCSKHKKHCSLCKIRASIFFPLKI